jgi:hypothetical protein
MRNVVATVFSVYHYPLNLSDTQFSTKHTSARVIMNTDIRFTVVTNSNVNFKRRFYVTLRELTASLQRLRIVCACRSTLGHTPVTSVGEVAA